MKILLEDLRKEDSVLGRKRKGETKMKKAVAVILALAMTFSLAACSGNKVSDSEKNSSKDSKTESTEKKNDDNKKFINDDSPWPTGKNNDFYYDRMKAKWKGVLNEKDALVSVKNHVKVKRDTELKYRGAAKLKNGEMAQVDMVLDGKTLFSFYIDQGSGCHVLDKSGNVCDVYSMPVEKSSLISDARKVLSDIYYECDYIDSSDKVEGENGNTYYRVQEEEYSNQQSMRTYLRKLFTEEKAEEVMKDISKKWIEKNGAYYAPEVYDRADEAYAFVAYRPKKVTANKIIFNQIFYYYNMDKENQHVKGLHKETETECILVKEGDNWVLEKCELPHQN